jgi:hypothetical protein
MAKLDPRRCLDELIKERGESYSSISRLLSRNAAYIQQFIKRGSPARLDDSDIAQLSVHFGVPGAIFGGDEVPESAGLSTIAIPVLGATDAGDSLGSCSPGRRGVAAQSQSQADGRFDCHGRGRCDVSDFAEWR